MSTPQPPEPQQPAPASTVTFDSYVYHAAEAARIARDAITAHHDLVTRIHDLEAQLSVVKLGHQEEAKKARDAQKQLDIGDQIIYCVLDGDGCLFHRALVAKGRDGGREAARALINHLDDYAASKGIRGQLTIVVHLYLNKAGLAKVYQSTGIADEATFSAFLLGFNAAHPLILVSDVGPSKEASDAKLTHSLKLFAKLPSTKLVVAGAAHDGGYAHLFSSLETEAPAVFEKVTLLKSYDDLAFELKRLHLRTAAFDGLFESRKLVAWAMAPPVPPHTPKRPSPAPAASASAPAVPVTGTAGHGKTPKTVRKDAAAAAAHSSAAAATPTAPSAATSAAAAAQSATPVGSANGNGNGVKVKKLRPIDPTKPLHKQSTPVCNAYYLRGTCDPSRCRYAHDYALTPAQLVTLRQDAKKSPCATALQGRECTVEGCFMGHTCPRGVRCAFGKACRFSAPGMHPPGTKGRTDGWAWQGPDLGPSSVAQRKTAGRAARGFVQSSEDDSEDESEEGGSGFETTSSVD
ncbi:hypothetical protein Rhopal_006656-T1 [Rhodotorula paludigena]|uniref:C3H1-type domain-containing protein n=1 Tax=Rhodotorula paludigena TaxID=86838 RepID=A0AAV5GUJ1_9BASI|nr:hypothetical protein Rhopal_006656-T1 [Rhodotorula paludigena]